jgi:hapalindole-type alkaloid chlorinase
MKTIIGDNIFNNFIEVDFNNQDADQNYIEQIYQSKLDGFVTRGVLSTEEVKEILDIASKVKEEDCLPTSNGRLFPYPYATISDKEKTLDGYINKNEALLRLPLEKFRTRIQDFFNKYSGSFNAKVPKVLKSDTPSAYGTFRFFMPKMGGLFVHCGYFFQEEHAIYFDVVEEMDKAIQFSFFMMLQYPENGGALTIYDMLWPEVNAKDVFENNEYVLDKNRNKVYLKDVETFSVRPEPGDILIFNGGPIWHRVEEIEGTRPRISFGGFINFSKDGKDLFYWG